MNPDLVGAGIAVHGTLCAASVIAIWKLHGESRFGKEPQEDMQNLRGRVLAAISQSLLDTFEPILTLATSAKIYTVITGDNEPGTLKPKITTPGREKLLDAVRDFVKSDVELMKALRSLDAADTRITLSLVWLRRLTLALAVLSGVFLVLAATCKFELWSIRSAGTHYAGFILAAILVIAAFAFIGQISHSVNVFEKLRDKHVDLS